MSLIQAPSAASSFAVAVAVPCAVSVYIFSPCKFPFKRSSVKLMLRYKDGSLEGPVDVLGGMLLRDAFVPANQRGQINLLVGAPQAPEKAAGRNEKDYHEQLRAYLNEHFSGLSGFVLYDDLNHFQINLPRWRSEPKKPE